MGRTQTSTKARKKLVAQEPGPSRSLVLNRALLLTSRSVSLTTTCRSRIANRGPPGHCYLPMTMLWTSTSSAVEVTSLQKGQSVLDFQGQSLEVVHVCVHGESQRRLVQLKTRATSITVTADHRIVVSLDGSMAEKRAAELKKG